MNCRYARLEDESDEQDKPKGESKQLRLLLAEIHDGDRISRYWIEEKKRRATVDQSRDEEDAIKRSKAERLAAHLATVGAPKTDVPPRVWPEHHSRHHFLPSGDDHTAVFLTIAGMRLYHFSLTEVSHAKAEDIGEAMFQLLGAHHTERFFREAVASVLGDDFETRSNVG